MFHGVKSLKLQYKGTQGYLKAVEKQQIIQWIRAQSYLRLSDLQKYLKKQYDVVFDILQSYYNLLKEAGITWEKLTHINLYKNDELVKEKKVREELLVKWRFINGSLKACSVYG